MKFTLKIVIILLFVSNAINAQIPAGTFTVNGKTFVAMIDTEIFSSGERMAPNTMGIFLQSGTIMNPVTHPDPTRECLTSVIMKSRNKPDFLRYFNILRSVFPATRCTAIFNHDNLTIGMIGVHCTFNITANGVIKDVAFQISENNIITPQEIELLHTRLMQQMSFTTNPINCPSYAGFMFEDDMKSVEDFNIIHTEPYYFGNGPAWTNR